MGKVKTTKKTLFNNKINKLGSGFFSSVYRLDNGSIYKKFKVRKIARAFDKSEQDIKKMAKKECLLQQNLSHDSILKCFGICEEPLGLYLEDIGGISLTNYLVKNQSVDINKRIKIAKMLANGVAYMHNEKIAHGDIKTDNIIVSENADQVKIADFGVAIHQKNGEEFELHDNLYSLHDDIGACPDKVDIIQFGLTLKTIFSDFFKGIDDEELMAKFDNKENQDIINLINIRELAYADGVANIVQLMKKDKSFSKPAITFLANTPKEIELLINECTSPNPSQRPNADYILGELSKY